jgi:hypothetical protein
VLAAEHLLDFTALHGLVEQVQCLAELDFDRLAGLSPFAEHRKVFVLLLERRDEVAVLFKPPAVLQDLLCFCLVFPEIGRGGARFEAGQFLFGP